MRIGIISWILLIQILLPMQYVFASSAAPKMQSDTHELKPKLQKHRDKKIKQKSAENHNKMHRCSATAYNKIDGESEVNSVAYTMVMSDVYNQEMEIPKNCILLFGDLKVSQILNAKTVFVVVSHPVTGEAITNPIVMRTKHPHYRINETLDSNSLAHYVETSSYTTILGEIRAIKVFRELDERDIK